MDSISIMVLVLIISILVVALFATICSLVSIKDRNYGDIIVLTKLEDDWDSSIYEDYIYMRVTNSFYEEQKKE